jgi:hypothetical protein
MAEAELAEALCETAHLGLVDVNGAWVHNSFVPEIHYWQPH